MRHIDHFLPISIHYDPPLHDYRGICKMRDIDHFWPFSWVTTHDLWSIEDFDAP